MARLRPFQTLFFFIRFCIVMTTKLSFHVEKICSKAFFSHDFWPVTTQFLRGSKVHFKSLKKKHKTHTQPHFIKAKKSLCKDVTPYHKNRKI